MSTVVLYNNFVAPILRAVGRLPEVDNEIKLAIGEFGTNLRDYTSIDAEYTTNKDGENISINEHFGNLLTAIIEAKDSWLWASFFDTGTTRAEENLYLLETAIQDSSLDMDGKKNLIDRIITERAKLVHKNSSSYFHNISKNERHAVINARKRITNLSWQSCEWYDETIDYSSLLGLPNVGGNDCFINTALQCIKYSSFKDKLAIQLDHLFDHIAQPIMNKVKTSLSNPSNNQHITELNKLILNWIIKPVNLETKLLEDFAAHFNLPLELNGIQDNIRKNYSQQEIKSIINLLISKVCMKIPYLESDLSSRETDADMIRQKVKEQVNQEITGLINKIIPPEEQPEMVDYAEVYYYNRESRNELLVSAVISAVMINAIKNWVFNSNSFNHLSAIKAIRFKMDEGNKQGTAPEILSFLTSSVDVITYHSTEDLEYATNSKLEKLINLENVTFEEIDNAFAAEPYPADAKIDRSEYTNLSQDELPKRSIYYEYLTKTIGNSNNSELYRSLFCKGEEATENRDQKLKYHDFKHRLIDNHNKDPEAIKKMLQALYDNIRSLKKDRLTLINSVTNTPIQIANADELAYWSGLIIHRGSVYSNSENKAVGSWGHYYCYVRIKEEGEKYTWYYFNDKYVDKIGSDQDLFAKLTTNRLNVVACY